jgi:hypothetical protein
MYIYYKLIIFIYSTKIMLLVLNSKMNSIINSFISPHVSSTLFDNSINFHFNSAILVEEQICINDK